MASWRARLVQAFALDLRSLALFRAGLGLLLLYDLLNRSLDLSDHYTDRGVLPLSITPEPEFGSPLLSLHLLSGSFGWQALLFFLAAACAVGLLVGWRTRLMTLLSFLLLSSLHARNPLICYEADTLLALLLFWSLFLPLGAVGSLDARSRPPPTTPRVASMGGAALILQVCFVYWFAALNKTGEPWWDGTAVAYALAVDQYATPLGSALREVSWLTAALTWGTLVIEGLVPFLLISPAAPAAARAVGIALIGAMQVGFFATMDLGIFPAVSLLALLALVPGEVWTRARREASLPPLREEPWSWRSDLAALLVLISLAWNVFVVGDHERRKLLPRPLLTAIQLLRLDQSWAMFAPEPMIEDGWFVISARLRDDSLVDLFSGADPLSWEKPPSPSRAYRSDRWKEFLMTSLERDPLAGYWARTAELAARDWDEDHSPERAVVSLSIVFVIELTLPPGTGTAPPQRNYLWTKRVR